MITMNGLRENIKTEKQLRKKSTVTKGKTTKDTPNSPFNEKKELISCNNRLERYIAFQRTKDQKMEALESQVEELRENLAEEKSRVRNSVKQTLDKLQEEKNNCEKRIVSLRTNCETAKGNLKTIKSEFELKKKTQKEIEKRLNILIKKREKDLSILNRVNSLAQKYRVENKAMSAKCEFLSTENKKIRAERDDFSQAYNELRGQSDKRQSDAQFLDKTYKDMVSSYEKEINAMKIKMDDLEEELRNEFNEQLNETLESRQKLFNKEKEKMSKELIKNHEEKTTALRKGLEEKNSEVQEITRSIEDSENRLEKAKLEKEKAVSTLEAQKRKNEILEQEIANLKLKPIRKEQHNAHVLKLLKEAYKKKEIEVEALEEQKAALTLEIQSYRDLLDREERRQDFLRERRTSTLQLPTPAEDQKVEDANDKENVEKIVKKDAEVKKQVQVQETKKVSKRRRSLRPRRSSGRFEGVPAVEEKNESAKAAKSPVKKRKTKADEKEAKSSSSEEEEKAAALDCVFECEGTEKRIEIRNKSAKAVEMAGWRLVKEGGDSSAIKSVEFPHKIDKNEIFYVYPTESLMAEDKEKGLKKVWNEAAFSPESGDIVIENESGVGMYKFEIRQKMDEEEEVVSISEGNK